MAVPTGSAEHNGPAGGGFRRFVKRVKRVIYPEPERYRRVNPKVLTSSLTSIDRNLRSIERTLRSIDDHLGRMDGPANGLPQISKSLEQTVKSLQILPQMRDELVHGRKISDVVRVRLTGPVVDEVHTFLRDHQLSLAETLHRLAADEISFARFGDGEFRLMTHPEYNIRFQPNSAELMAALREVFGSTPAPSTQLMMGFPSLFRDLNGSGVWSAVWSQVKPLIPADITYGNSHVSRPLVFQLLGQQAVQLWRQVWQDRHIAIITGEGSRFELVPALFDNVASSRFIYSTPVDAFADLDRLLDVIDHDAGADLYLISLGPTGTILAAQLAERGRRAIDIGHISDSYLNVVEGAPWPEAKPLKKTS